MDTVIQKLEAMSLEQSLKMANKLADNQYNEACGFTRIYMDAVGQELSWGYSHADAKMYAAQRMERIVFDVINEVD